jgi:hypothetical protein
MCTDEQIYTVTKIFYPVSVSGILLELHTEKTLYELNKIAYNFGDGRLVTTYDSIDKDFLINKAQFEYKDLKGWHDYGGYHGLYKPSLKEEAEILLQNVKFDQIIKYERIYVRPMSCVFSEKEDKHWGTTRFYFVPTDKIKSTVNNSIHADNSIHVDNSIHKDEEEFITKIRKSPRKKVKYCK